MGREKHNQTLQTSRAAEGHGHKAQQSNAIYVSSDVVGQCNTTVHRTRTKLQHITTAVSLPFLNMSACTIVDQWLIEHKFAILCDNNIFTLSVGMHMAVTVCGTHSFEHVHIVTKWFRTMNLATKCAKMSGETELIYIKPMIKRDSVQIASYMKTSTFKEDCKMASFSTTWLRLLFKLFLGFLDSESSKYHAQKGICAEVFGQPRPQVLPSFPQGRCMLKSRGGERGTGIRNHMTSYHDDAKINNAFKKPAFQTGHIATTFTNHTLHYSL